jgi:hypothetical protein
MNQRGNMKKRNVTLLLGAALLAGCAFRGTPFAWSDVDALRPGVTTYTQAVAQLGKPNHELIDERGVKWVQWRSWVDLGLGTVYEQGVRVRFDKDDRMIEVFSRTGTQRQ